jgi:hypothetical protein
VLLILQHLMQVSVERQYPASLPPVAVCTQTILSYSVVTVLWER